MYGKPATWINVAASGRGTGADATLAVVLGHIGATVMSTSGFRVPVPHQALDAGGRISDHETRTGLAEAFRRITAELLQTEARTR